LKQISITNRARMIGSSQPYAMAGRVLILFTALLLIAMPWTEYFWNFDKFLHGGQDFELGLLSTLTVFRLLLVLLQHGKLGVALILAFRRWLWFVFQQADPAAPGSLWGLITSHHAVPLPRGCWPVAESSLLRMR
jgi:hypothetical protein